MPKLWNEVPFFVCDNFYVEMKDRSTPGDNVRIAFGHGIDAESVYHTGISMNRSNAAELRDLIDKFLKATTAPETEEKIGKRGKINSPT